MIAISPVTACASRSYAGRSAPCSANGEATDHSHHQVGVALLEPVRSKPEALGRRGSRVVHQQVRARSEQVKQLAAPIGPQVDHDDRLLRLTAAK